MKTAQTWLLFTLLILLQGAAIAGGPAFRVDNEAEAGGTGATWQAAFRSIQEGVDAASAAGGPSAYDIGAVETRATGLTATPPTIDFGTQLVGNSRVSFTTLRNDGTLPVELAGTPIIVGDSARVFSIVPNQGIWPIRPGQSADFQVRFSPTDTTPRTATLAIPTLYVLQSLVEVQLTGRAIEASELFVSALNAMLDVTDLPSGAFSSADANSDGVLDAADLKRLAP